MKPHEKFVGEPDCKHSFPRKTRESPGPVEQRQPLLRALDRQRSDQVFLAGEMSENGSLGILHLPGQLVEVEPGKPALVEHLPRSIKEPLLAVANVLLPSRECAQGRMIDRLSKNIKKSRTSIRNRVGSIVADGFDRAFFHGRQAGGLLGGILGLAMDVTVALGVVAPEALGSRFATEVAVDAGGINIELPGDIFR